MATFTSRFTALTMPCRHSHLNFDSFSYDVTHGGTHTSSKTTDHLSQVKTFVSTERASVPRVHGAAQIITSGIPDYEQDTLPQCHHLPNPYLYTTYITGRR